ncbi:MULTISPECIES: restriction endonuclease subunit S [Bacillaceae]|uniref:Restriction endonuclease subunit S n=1 Tax=Terrilactibacillus tamarindi TaxID=2599694 RepID=A0A6N8CSW6_9BACI|nr:MULTISPECIES: restriction endonuclease subunit S [Bacillaceae]AQX53041.1 hypothetical protein BC359_01215 [Priestia flexa]EOR25774.1 type I restriction modification DNA specificity domain-containing protein [Niallia nealsonii AAU1]MTT31096.1 restriction endonuclease subunit S [Terrilactibacillus tamarindi]
MNKLIKDSDVEWIGEIPHHWNIVYFHQFFKQIKNKNVDLQEKNLLSLSYGNIVRKDINSKDGLLPENFDGYNIIEKGDIVLRLTDLQNDHKSLRVGLSTERGIITSAYVSIRKKSKDLYEKFAYYYLHTFDLVKGFYGMGAGVRQGLNFDGLKKLPVLLPPLNEQIEIVKLLDEKLSRTNSIIENTKLSVEELKNYKQTLIKQLITKGLNQNVELMDSGIDFIGEVPVGWAKKKISWIFETIGSGTTPKSTNENYYDGNIHWLNTGDLNDGFINDTKRKITKTALDEVSSLKIYPKNSLVIAMYGATIGKLGITQIPVTTNQACCVMSEAKHENIRFIFYWLLGIRKKIVSLGYGGTQPNISQETIKNIKIPLPPIDEQNEIVKYLDNKCLHIDSLIERKEQFIIQLEEYKKSIIYEYVTGKKGVL